MKKAIVFGINNGIDRKPLNNAEADAEMIFSILPHLGFSQCVLVTGDDETTGDKICESLRELTPDGKSDIFIWFSCHGSSADNNEFFVHALDRKLSKDEIISNIQVDKGNSCAIVFDACRTADEKVSMPKRKSMDRIENKAIFYSTHSGREAYDGMEQGHSLYSEAFMQALSYVNDGSAISIFKEVKKRVSEMSGGLQEPELEDMSGTDFPVFTKSSTSIIPSPYFIDFFGKEKWNTAVWERLKGKNAHFDTLLPSGYVELMDADRYDSGVVKENRLYYKIMTEKDLNSTYSELDVYAETVKDDRRALSKILTLQSYILLIEWVKADDSGDDSSEYFNKAENKNWEAMMMDNANFNAFHQLAYIHATQKHGDGHPYWGNNPMMQEQEFSMLGDEDGQWDIFTPLIGIPMAVITPIYRWISGKGKKIAARQKMSRDNLQKAYNCIDSSLKDDARALMAMYGIYDIEME